MSRVRVHLAVPHAMRQVAVSLAGLLGHPMEFSVPLTAIPGSPSGDWDNANGYAGQWWGCSQSFAPEIAETMLADGLTKRCEAWFVAFDEDTGQLIEGATNLTDPPVTPDFDAFAASAGLARAAQ